MRSRLACSARDLPGEDPPALVDRVHQMGIARSMPVTEHGTFRGKRLEGLDGRVYGPVLVVVPEDHDGLAASCPGPVEQEERRDPHTAVPSFMGSLEHSPQQEIALFRGIVQFPAW